MKYINYLLIIIGALITVYIKIEDHQYLLVLGIVMLMYGVYKISKTVPSKQDREGDSPVKDNKDV